MTSRYQDFVIKDGKLVGKFEEMYQQFDDPWLQSGEGQKIEKQVLIDRLKHLGVKRVIELGCGHGHYSKALSEHFDVLGIDISPSAIAKAQKLYPDVKFTTSDINNFEVFKSFNPDVIILAEITWYVLDQLASLKNFINREKKILLAQLLTVYPAEQQTYGKEYFSDLPSILKFFNLHYLEYGEFGSSDSAVKRTFFVGKSK